MRKLAKRFSNETEDGGVVETGHLSALSPIGHNTRSPNPEIGVGTTRAKPSAPAMQPQDLQDITGGLGFREPALSWEDFGEANTTKLPTKVYGSDSFKHRCYVLLREFADVFSSTIDTTPSRVTPMTLQVDLDQWHQPKNRLGYRMQSTFKQEEIDRQVAKMLAAGVIEPSQAPYYSHVHLVP